MDVPALGSIFTTPRKYVLFPEVVTDEHIKNGDASFLTVVVPLTIVRISSINRILRHFQNGRVK